MLQNVFGRKTVDSILTQFNKTIEELRKHSVDQLAEADTHDVVRAQAEASAEQARLEALRAEAVATQLESLIGAALPEAVEVQQ